jgi:hypothetical protein
MQQPAQNGNRSMTLEFNRVLQQVYNMSAMLEKLDFDIGERLDIATQRFASAGNLEDVYERIRWVRESDISRYRGATPLPDPDIAEPVNLIVDPPSAPQEATVIAVDGSQVYPDEHALVHYYLINIGIFVYHHGSEMTPQQITHPQLFFHKDHVHDKYGAIIRNSTVDDRRTLDEMARLAQASHDAKQANYRDPIIALYDNRLMYLPADDNTARSSEEKLRDFVGSMVRLHDSGATLAGYIDNPFRSKRFVQLLYLLSMKDRDDLYEHRENISRAGDLEGLTDAQFFFYMLQDGQRSALMVQNSPQNLQFRNLGENYEIAFFFTSRCIITIRRRWCVLMCLCG